MSLLIRDHKEDTAFSLSGSWGHDIFKAGSVWLEFLNSIYALSSNVEKEEQKAILIVRRNRSIARGTGTLLSQDDRILGDAISKYPVLTLYRIEGEKEKNWNGNPIWIPNIKLPIGKNFYRVEK